MSIRSLPVLLALLVSKTSAAPSQDVAGTDPLPAAEAAVTRAELEHHTAFLASDALLGRELGTEGNRRAARYLASVLGAAGLEPLQPDQEGGAFFQSFPGLLIEHRSAPRLVLLSKGGEEEVGEYGADFQLLVQGQARTTELLPILTVRVAPDLPKEPQADRALFVRASPVDRRDWLSARGQFDANDWGMEIIPQESVKRGRPRGAPRRVVLLGEPEAEGCETVQLRGPMRENLMWNGYTHARLEFDEVRTEVLEHNVVAVLPGSDPELAQEIVLLQADYDYLGSVPAAERPGKDHVRNGANPASTCAALLELAQAFAAGERPARTLVFLFTTASVGGRAGLERFLEAGLVDAERVVAMLSLRHLGKPDAENQGSGRVWLSGIEHSNLGAAFAERGLAVTADPYESALHQRGPNALFQRRGVVAHSVFCLPPDYDHDAWADEAEGIDYEHLETVTRTLHAAVGALADGSIRPVSKKAGRSPKRRGRKTDEEQR